MPPTYRVVDDPGTQKDMSYGHVRAHSRARTLACTYAFTHTHTHTQTHTHTHARTHARTHTHTHTLKCIYSSSSFGFSHQGSPQRIFHLHLFLYYYVSSSVTSASAMYSFIVSILAFPVSSVLATPSSASFSQYTHHSSSIHDQTTSVLHIVFLDNPPHLCCPSDVLIPDIVHSCHS